MRKKFKRYANRLVEKSTLKERSSVADLSMSSKKKHDEQRHDKHSKGSTVSNKFPDKKLHTNSSNSHKTKINGLNDKTDVKQILNQSDNNNETKPKIITFIKTKTKETSTEPYKDIVSTFGLRTPTKESSKIKQSDSKNVTQTSQSTVTSANCESDILDESSISKESCNSLIQTLSASFSDLSSPASNPLESESPSLSQRSDSNKSYQSEFESHVTNIIVKTEVFNSSNTSKRRSPTKLPTTPTEQRKIVKLQPTNSSIRTESTSSSSSVSSVIPQRRPQMSFEHALLQSDLNCSKVTQKSKLSSSITSTTMKATPADVTSKILKKFSDKYLEIPFDAHNDRKLFNAYVLLSRKLVWPQRKENVTKLKDTMSLDINERLKNISTVNVKSDADADVDIDVDFNEAKETCLNFIPLKIRRRSVCVKFAMGNGESVKKKVTIDERITDIAEAFNIEENVNRLRDVNILKNLDEMNVSENVLQVETIDGPKSKRSRGRPKRNGCSADCCESEVVDDNNLSNVIDDQKKILGIEDTDDSSETESIKLKKRKRRKKSIDDLRIVIRGGNEIIKKPKRPLLRFKLMQPQRNSSAQTVPNIKYDEPRIYNSYVRLIADDPVILDHMKKLEQQRQFTEIDIFPLSSKQNDIFETCSIISESPTVTIEQNLSQMLTSNSNCETTLHNAIGQRVTNFIYPNGVIVSGCAATNPFESPCTTIGSLTPNYTPNAIESMYFAYMQPTPPYDSPSGNTHASSISTTPFDPNSLINMQPTPPYDPHPQNSEGLSILSVETLPRLQPEIAQKLCTFPIAQLANGINANYVNVVSHMGASATPLQEIQPDDLFKVLGTDSDDTENLLLDKNVNDDVDDIDVYIVNERHRNTASNDTQTTTQTIVNEVNFYDNNQTFDTNTPHSSSSSIVTGLVRTKASLKQIDDPLPSTEAELADFNRISLSYRDESISSKLLRNDNPLLNNSNETTPEPMLNHSSQINDAGSHSCRNIHSPSISSAQRNVSDKSCELGISFTTPSKQTNIQFEVDSMIIDEVFMNETDDGQIEKFCLELENGLEEKLQ